MIVESRKQFRKYIRDSFSKLKSAEVGLSHANGHSHTANYFALYFVRRNYYRLIQRRVSRVSLIVLFSSQDTTHSRSTN